MALNGHTVSSASRLNYVILLFSDLLFLLNLLLFESFERIFYSLSLRPGDAISLLVWRGATPYVYKTVI